MDLHAITPHLLQHLAQLGRREDVQALKRFTASKRHTLVAAFVLETRQAVLNQAAAMQTNT